MKVTLISTHAKKGGAGLAAFRLMKSLRDLGLDARMLAQQGSRDEGRVWITSSSAGKAGIRILRFLAERLTFLFREKSPELRFLFSPANFGERIHRHPLVRDADVLHLHWTQGAFLSLRSLRSLLATGKPVVWTLHDMWAFTGGCHYALECRGFEKECGMCPYVKKPGRNDLSHRIWKRKKRIFPEAGLHLVCPSGWLEAEVRASALLGGFPVTRIHNPVDETRFFPVRREEACAYLGLDPQKRYVLFGAATVKNMLKGLDWFREAVELLHRSGDWEEGVEILLLGKSREDLGTLFPCPVNALPYSGSQETIRACYNASSLFAIPSLADNLPNTILEAMLCGTPVVGFDSGGIREMIDHRESGYLARRKSAHDLADGLNWVLRHPEPAALSGTVRRRVLEKYPAGVAVSEYIALYRRLATGSNRGKEVKS
ncbi:MAG: glycosyltransferase [Bacteroidales bacterium]